MKLPGVVVSHSIQKKCPCCNTLLEARKVQVQWRRENKDSSAATYMSTDVLYCLNCRVGFYHSLFKKIKDSSGASWVVFEIPMPNNKKVVPTKPQKAATTNTKKPAKSAKTKPTIKISNSKKTNSNARTTNDYNERDSNHVVRNRAVITSGSPRSRHASPQHDSSGRFIHSDASKKYFNYSGE